MLQFLMMLIEWVAGGAMMLLGLSYTAPEACDMSIDLIAVHYVENVEPAAPAEAGCASFKAGEETDARVFRI